MESLKFLKMGGTSSKATFATHVQTILEKTVDSNDHDFWDELWRTVLTIEEIFEIITPDDCRKLIRDHHENIRVIFTQAVAQLYQVVETPYPIYFPQALNCARILARVLPFLLESKSSFVRELLWNKKFVKNAQEEGVPPGPEDTQESEPLAVILVNTMFHLLFLPEFTIDDPNVEFSESDLDTPAFKSALMWAPGVGSAEKTVVTSTQYDANRVDMLRLITTAFCDSLYQHPDTYDFCQSMWLEVATSVDTPYAEIVFYSLINTILGYDPIGWGVPYGNYLATDTAKLVMEHAIQVLLILLDYGHPIAHDPSLFQNGLPYVHPNDTQAQGFNVFRRFLGSIESHDQLNFLYRGFVRLLNNAHEVENAYLPYSVARVEIEQELLLLFWKCLEETPKFMPYILKHCDVTEILLPICYFMLQGRKDPSKVGLMYLCTFTLLKLSGERSFGVALNKSYQMRLPVELPLFTGNHADLLIIVLHKMIVSGSDKLSPLYSCFLTIICNVSPYCKSLCALSALKLTNLLKLFVSPKFFYAAEGNYIYVALLLETFNNLVQYQYEGNGNLIYAIVRRRDVFETLANLNLSAALSLLEQQQQKEHSRKAEGGPNGSLPSATAANTTTDGHGNAAKKLTRRASADEHDEVFAEGVPTDLISTKNMERRVDHRSGEIEDVHTTEATSKVASTTAVADDSAAPTDRNIDQPQSPLKKAAASAASSAASARFVPTEEWLEKVKAELSLNTLLRLLKHLVPQIEDMVSKAPSVDEKQVIDFIKSTTMVGLLPVPHPIVIRKYQPNKFTCLWFTAFQWGVIFMHNQNLPLFDGRHVKLFLVQQI